MALVYWIQCVSLPSENLLVTIKNSHKNLVSVLVESVGVYIALCCPECVSSHQSVICMGTVCPKTYLHIYFLLSSWQNKAMTFSLPVCCGLAPPTVVWPRLLTWWPVHPAAAGPSGQINGVQTSSARSLQSHQLSLTPLSDLAGTNFTWKLLGNHCIFLISDSLSS